MNTNNTIELKAVKQGIITFLMNYENHLLKNTQEIGLQHQQSSSVKKMSNGCFKNTKTCGSLEQSVYLSKSSTLPNSENFDDLGLSKVESEHLSTSGSLSSLEEEMEAEKRKIRAQTEDASDRAQSHYTSLLLTLEKRIPSISDNTYAHSVMLFKKVMDVLYASKYNNKIFPSKMPKYIPPTPVNHLLTPSRIYKACLFLSYKIIEDEFMLFLSDFCKVAKEDQKALERLEIIVMIDILNFDMKAYNYETIVEEKKILSQLGLEIPTRSRFQSA